MLHITIMSWRYREFALKKRYQFGSIYLKLSYYIFVMFTNLVHWNVAVYATFWSSYEIIGNNLQCYRTFIILKNRSFFPGEIVPIFKILAILTFPPELTYKLLKFAIRPLVLKLWGKMRFVGVIHMIGILHRIMLTNVKFSSFYKLAHRCHLTRDDALYLFSSSAHSSDYEMDKSVQRFIPKCKCQNIIAVVIIFCITINNPCWHVACLMTKNANK